MGDNVEFKLIKNTLPMGIDAYKKAVLTASEKTALPKIGLQLINWIVNGSPNESVTPPILEGTLRGSGSVFVGNKYIGAIQKYKGTPATSGNFPKSAATVVFNTAYAAKLHDFPFNPGPVSRQAGNVGYKYIKKHLKADKNDLMKMYAEIIKKETN